MTYREVPSQVDFPALERRILDFWRENDCFGKLVEKNRGGRRWSFLDGPITANNPMGVHHAWGRTYKDIFQRYHGMLGHEQRFQNGFDGQGLWVEVEVEKELGFRSKRDIEAYGIARFVEKCKERVRKYAAIQTAQSVRLGYWMNWDGSYHTMSDENNYTIWSFLKRCHDRGFVYKGTDVMPWCSRCGTGLSQHEIATEGYRELTHTSIYLRLPLRGRPREWLLVWTTTPWTLTSNVAAAVKPDGTYVAAERDGEVYYVIKDRLGVLGPSVRVRRELPGRELLGWVYGGPYDMLPPQQGVEHRVIPWDEVSEKEGTGIVHIAPGCGAEDFELSREHGLAVIAPLDEFGIFVDGFQRWTGRGAADVAEDIVADLRERGLLVTRESYTHSYPVCWRCSTELVFRLVDEWYIRMDELRYEIMEVTRKTRWIPPYGLDRELDWLQNMRDWMISKKRYWGLALPIYECSCGGFDVIGSREELHRRAVSGWEEFEGRSPHRPWVDAVRIACPRCDKPVSRIPDVGNPWLDAGIVPYSTLRYNEDREYWAKWFPADLISESFPGQFRNWFYSILAMSAVMERREPFKVIFGYALMRDEQGREMHKSLGNAVEFNEAAERAGADAMRWLFASHNPELNLNFGYRTVDDARRRFLFLWNVYSFFVTYARLDRFDPGAAPVPVPERNALDRWILSRLQRLITTARRSYEGYQVHVFMREAEAFTGDLSNWYVRRSRRRFWKGEDDRDKRAAYQTLYEVLTTLTRLLAPVIPFATEEIYQNLVRTQDPSAPVSVHLAEFPQARGEWIDDDLDRTMASVLGIVELGRAARKQANLKIRQPLAEIRVKLRDDSRRASIDPFRSEILDELNVKSIVFAENLADLVRYEVGLEAKVLGPRFGRSFPAVLAAVKALDPAGVAARRREPLVLEVEGEEVSLDPGEFRVRASGVEGWSVAEGDVAAVALATRLTEDLENEGLVRDLVRHVQNHRKEMGLAVSDRIRLWIIAGPRMGRAVGKHREYLVRETLTVDLRMDGSPGPQAKTIKAGGEEVNFWLEVVRTD